MFMLQFGNPEKVPYQAVQEIYPFLPRRTVCLPCNSFFPAGFCDF